MLAQEKRVSANAGSKAVPLPRFVWQAATIVTGVAILTASAKIEVPFWPVPMTLETLAALGLGGFLGARRAGASVLLWLAIGLAGAPVFAGAMAGPAYLAGPTGGYLVGLFAAALFVGWAVRRGAAQYPALLFLVMVEGAALIYLCGVSYLALTIGAEKAIALGMLPFLPADLTKAALATALVLLAGRRATRP